MYPNSEPPRPTRTRARLALLTLLASGAAQPATLDGITILHLADPGAAHVITGTETGMSPYLTVYVALNGTYASVGDGVKTVQCVAWADQSTYTGTSITFGLPATEQTIRVPFPPVCQPFTLELQADGRIRLTASNPVSDSVTGPLAPGTQQRSYDRAQDVLLRAPLVALDWGHALYATYAIKGVRLGPLPAMRAGLNADAKVAISPLQITYAGAHKPVNIDQTPTDTWNVTRVTGDLIAAERLGWPWDALYGTQYKERLRQRSLTEAFDRSLAERYGKPHVTLRQPSASRREHYWLFGLSGEPTVPDARGPDVCGSTRELWEKWHEPLYRFNSDVGPWNCGLVVHVRDDANSKGTVGNYEMQTVNGYAAALNHFAWRVEQLQEVQASLQAVRGDSVEL